MMAKQTRGSGIEMLEFLFVGPLFSVFKKLNRIERKLEDMATQAEIDALTQRVTAVGETQTKALGEVRDEIQKLTEANPDLDVSGLEAAVGNAESGASALDDVVPDVLPGPTPEPETPSEENPTGPDPSTL